MENLIRRMNGEIRVLVFLLILCAGVVTSAGYISAGKSRKKYRIKLDDGSEKGLSLYIHKSLIEDYGIEEGSYYVVTYYPRPDTLCEAKKRR